MANTLATSMSNPILLSEEAMDKALKAAIWSATETLFYYSDENASSFYPYNEGFEDSVDDEEEDIYHNCSVSITITHNNQTFTI